MENCDKPKYSFGGRSLKSLEGVHPDLVKVLSEAIRFSPHDFTVVEGVRTVKRQQELYAQGRTKPGPKVTNADGVKNKSNHQPKADGYGYAVDLYPYFDGKVQVSGREAERRLKEIAVHILLTAQKLGIKVEWGGNWRFTDPPHFELKK
ncbi:peptidoglycan L-alanyl-D-glutamate endopeptidase CwlK [Cruoricaptor ignavus]|uniref:Peptidoglycan L-alanyl-D-glutamate endopeptidase CwlK n=1 Tax=Cruoricaptor ignavus TaxID=1118202 RepID=A0A1M6HCM2_9FLAO|nr:M15 family metallopeptidase [Cruoricaptor ignavus]SHJ20018.1 peptidoglycan L-alanyl-D-glutamate endopeptidase CwlK [Cruoricaptor ignavus]